MKKENKITEAVVLETKRTDLHHIDSRNIVVEEKFNKRGEDNYGNIHELSLNIVANGIMEDLLGFKKRGEEVYVMTEGHRRLRAVKYAFAMHAKGEAGFENVDKILRIPMRMASEKLVDRLYIMATTGFGKVPLKEFEKAELYEQLISLAMADGKKRGQAIKELITRLGVSTATVYNTLKLNELDPDIKAFVASGQLSGATAITIVKEITDPEKQKEAVLEAIYNAEDKAKATGSKAKATAANVKGLKAKSLIQKLKEVSEKLEEKDVKNIRTKLLTDLIEALDEKKSVNVLVNLFL